MRTKATDWADNTRMGGSNFMLSALTMRQLKDIYAKEFGDTSKPLPKDPPGGRPERGGRPKPQIDDAVVQRALTLYEQQGSVKKVAEQMLDDLPWSTLGSATESLRRLIRDRQAVAA